METRKTKERKFRKNNNVTDLYTYERKFSAIYILSKFCGISTNIRNRQIQY